MSPDVVPAMPPDVQTLRGRTPGPTAASTLPPLPTLPEPTSAVTGLAMIALPVASGAGALIVALGRPGSAMAIGSLVVLVASVAVGVLLFVGQRRGTAARIARQRRRYLHLVEAVDGRLRAQTDRARGAGADSAATARLGFVTVAAPVPSPAPAADGLSETDPVCAAAVADLRVRRGTAHAMPLDLPLRSLGRLIIDGPGEAADALLRRMILDLARTLPPRRLAIVVSGSQAHPWVRWLPHCTRGVVLGRPDRSLRADLVDPVDDPLPDLRGAPDLRIIVDLRLDNGPPGSHRPAPAVGDGPQILQWTRTSGPAGADDTHATRVLVGPDEQVTVRIPGGPVVSGRTAGVCADRARMLARDIARRPTTGPGAAPQRDARPEASIPGDPVHAGPADGADRLRVVIGRGPHGAAVELDLKDAAEGGVGPHGLVVGATGSGKSELLRGLTLRLVERHHPGELVLLLVDYKGGSTFAPFSRLPHVAGLLTNLAGDQHLTDRFAIALRGESVRRQAVLARAGVSDIGAYRRLAAPVEPLPVMLVVVDEYSELLAAHPDLADLFTGLGRVGRSLGLHLLLATQRLDPGRSRGVESHLSYKIVLRTFTAAESQELLGSTAAFTLPRAPGEALLVTAGDTPVRLRIDRCAVPAGTPAVAGDPPAAPTGPLPFPEPSDVRSRLLRLSRLLLTEPDRADATEPPGDDPLGNAVTAVAERLIDHPCGARARPVWLPPLPERLALDALPVPAGTDRGDRPGLSIGLVDRPATQEQTTMIWTPVSQPNLAVSGTGRSGRSSALLTVIAAAGLAATPGTVEVYGVALGGATLVAARGWPHVVGIAGADDSDFAARLLRLVVDEIDLRERAPAPRDLRVPGDPERPLILFVVDDWAPSGALDGDIDRLIADAATRGPAVGIATAVATAAGSVLRGRVAGAFGTRLELRAADAFESAIDRRLAASLPAGVPGRALAVEGIVQLALPPAPSATTSGASALHLRWAGRSVARRHPLPPGVRLEHLWSPTPDGPVAGSPDQPVAGSPDQPVAGSPNRRHRVVTGRDGAPAPGEAAALEVAVGVEERHGPAVRHRLGRPDAHLAVLGDPGSGRTMVLRSIAQQLAHAGRPVVLVAVDLRGDLTSTDLGIAWSATARRVEQVGPLVGDLQRYLAPPGRTGVDPPTSARAQPVDRAPVVVLVDDEELLTGGVGHPLAPLLSAARSGADLGVHLVVARSSGGFGRARFEPLHQMLADLGTPTLLLSSSPEEGRLTHRLLPRPLPPGRAQWAVRGRPPHLLQTPIAMPGLRDIAAGKHLATRPGSAAVSTGTGSTVQ